MKRIPLRTAKPPFVNPTFFLSLETKPMTFADAESFQYCKIKTPDAMNMAAPTNEKKRSTKKDKFINFH
jgi:hypothetical protein